MSEKENVNTQSSEDLLATANTDNTELSFDDTELNPDMKLKNKAWVEHSIQEKYKNDRDAHFGRFLGGFFVLEVVLFATMMLVTLREEASVTERANGFIPITIGIAVVLTVLSIVFRPKLDSTKLDDYQNPNPKYVYMPEYYRVAAKNDESFAYNVGSASVGNIANIYGKGVPVDGAAVKKVAAGKL